MKLVALQAAIIAGLVAIAAATSPGAALAITNCDADPGIDGAEQQLLGLVNQYRADNGVGPLALSETLSRAASWKAQDMATNDYFAHDDVPIDRTWIERLRDCGYTYNAWLAENIAAGNESAEATFEQWRNSPSHNRTMLNGELNAIGIGRASGSAQYGWYWTTDFGGFVDAATPTPVPTAAPTPTAPPPPGSTPDSNGDVNCSGTTNSVDATLVLQYYAGLMSTLPCPDEGDTNGDGFISVTDAALILQYAGGLIASLPPP